MREDHKEWIRLDIQELKAMGPMMVKVWGMKTHQVQPKLCLKLRFKTPSLHENDFDVLSQRVDDGIKSVTTRYFAIVFKTSYPPQLMSSK